MGYLPSALFRRTDAERADQMLSWQRSDQAFFASGACHILAWAFVESHSGFRIYGLRPHGAQSFEHVIAGDGLWAFDHCGWTPFAELLDAYDADAILITTDLETFCANNNHRLPEQYAFLPWQRARDYIARHNRRRLHPREVLEQITVATEDLLKSAAGFSDAEMRAPSLLPGWSRGHVLTHVARHADGGKRLLGWARTGVETPEYPSMAARAEEIEVGSGRGAAELVADVRHSAAQFALEYAKMPADAWDRIVRWTGGQELPALRAADSRLTEVLVHHVDLRAGYGPGHWPPPFVSDLLSRVVGSFTRRDEVAAMRCHATDTDSWYHIKKGEIKKGEDAAVICGGQASLLAWLIGRSDGADLQRQDGAALPALPPLF